MNKIQEVDFTPKGMAEINNRLEGKFKALTEAHNHLINDHQALVLSHNKLGDQYNALRAKEHNDAVIIYLWLTILSAVVLAIIFKKVIGRWMGNL